MKDGATLRLMAAAMRAWARQKSYPILKDLSEDDFLPFAYEALAAARVPTPAMTGRGAESLDLSSDGGLLGGVDEAAYNVWTAMVDRALAGK